MIRKLVLAVLSAATLASGTAPAAGVIASCSTPVYTFGSYGLDDHSACVSTFTLDQPALVLLRIDPFDSTGYLGARLRPADGAGIRAQIRATFVAGTFADGTSEVSVNLPAGSWKMEAYLDGIDLFGGPIGGACCRFGGSVLEL